MVSDSPWRVRPRLTMLLWRAMELVGGGCGSIIIKALDLTPLDP